MRKLHVATGLVVQLLWAGSCAAQAVDPGPIRVGDRWSYDVKDGFTGDHKQAVTIVVTAIDEKEITARVAIRGNDRPFTVVFDPGWGRIDDGTWKYRPSNLFGIRKPLQVGKEWRSEGDAMGLQSGLAFRTSGSAKVTGQEQVMVPAGTFDTFRVEMTVRQINATDQTKSSTFTFMGWYAPAVNRWVRTKSDIGIEGRIRSSDIDELTGYSRQP